jgi:hypothetical protein
MLIAILYTLEWTEGSGRVVDLLHIQPQSMKWIQWNTKNSQENITW